MFTTTKHISFLPLLALIVSFQVSAQPEITIGGTLEFCYGDSVTLCVSPEFSAYLWNTGATSQCAPIFESGDYFPVMLDSTGNIDSTLASQPVTVTVHHAQPYVIIVGDTIFVNQHYESYQWYMNSQIMIGETDSFLVPTITALYHVEITDEFGCVGSSPIFSPPFPFPYPDNINEYARFEFVLSPNPTAGHITVDLSGKKLQTATLMSITGKVVCEWFSNDTTGYLNLDLNGIDSGVYFIHIVLEDERHGIQRLVVQH